MVIDSFIFFNELEMLEFRLEELNDYVDYFILVESELTFTGQKKELFYQKNKSKFERFNHKIIHIISELPQHIDENTRADQYYEMLGFPTAPSMNQIQNHIDGHRNVGSSFTGWLREYLQRNDIIKGLNQIGVTDNDYIFICDVDEIWDVNILEELELNKTQKCDKLPFFGELKEAFKLIQTTYYYDLQCVGNWPTAATVLCRISNIIEHGGCNSLRNMQLNSIGLVGWHFSYFMSVENIKTKIKSFSHQEYNTSYYLDNKYIQDKIDKKIDLFERGNLFHYEPFDENNYWPKKLSLLKKIFNT